MISRWPIIVILAGSLVSGSILHTCQVRRLNDRLERFELVCENVRETLLVARAGLDDLAKRDQAVFTPLHHAIELHACLPPEEFDEYVFGAAASRSDLDTVRATETRLIEALPGPEPHP